MYKTVNLINNKYYIGIHTTDNLDDGYLGSGFFLKKALKKYGKTSFSKTIIEFFLTKSEALHKEKEVVTEELIKDINCYNIVVGGIGCNHNKTSSEKISKAAKNKVMARTGDGNFIKVTKQEFDNNPDLVGSTKGKVLVRDITTGLNLTISKIDPRYISGELVGITKGFAAVKDVLGNRFNVSVNDSRLKTGDLVGITKGSTQTVESNLKRSAALKGRKLPKRPYGCCIYCKKECDVANLKRWHMNNCKYKSKI